MCASGKISVAGLSPREREVLELLEEGLSYLEVARRLGISYNTVKVLVYRARRKGYAPRRKRLSRREREVLELLEEGYSYGEAAELLGVSYGTIDYYAWRLRRKGYWRYLKPPAASRSVGNVNFFLASPTARFFATFKRGFTRRRALRVLEVVRVEGTSYAAEVARRLGVHRGTAGRILRRLEAAGLVEVCGRGVAVFYCLTRDGVRVLEELARCRAGVRGGFGVGGGCGLRLGVGGGSGGVGCGVGGAVLGRVVVQERADGGREVGVRVGFKAYREVLAGLGVPGFDGSGPRRVKYSMFYVRGVGEGVVHFDHYTRLSRLECVEAGLWAVRGRVLAVAALCFSVMKWYGYTESFVRELWRRVPRLELEDRVYLEDGRGRVLGWWDSDTLRFSPAGAGLEGWLHGC